MEPERTVVAVGLPVSWTITPVRVMAMGGSVVEGAMEE